MGSLEGIGPEERSKVVAYCARFIGDPDAAEDLAQQTMLEAWRLEHRLRNPGSRLSWLFGIARNLCLRWVRVRARDKYRARLAPRDDPADSFDVELELEREDLARLLDRALALLPPDTRLVLVRRYVDESSQAEIADRLGTTEGAVEARLRRGKLALRRILATELAEEAAEYGLFAEGVGGWREARVWCAACGRRRLMGRLDRGALTLRCPACIPGYPREPSPNMLHLSDPDVLGGVKTFKPALARAMDHAYGLFTPALSSGVIACPACGRSEPLRSGIPEYVPEPRWVESGVYARCGGCGWVHDMSLAGLVLWTPEGRRFWREHPRIRLLPEREVESAGRRAVVTGYESLADGSRFEVVSAREGFRVLEVHAPSYAIAVGSGEQATNRAGVDDE